MMHKSRVLMRNLLSLTRTILSMGVTTDLPVLEELLMTSDGNSVIITTPAMHVQHSLEDMNIVVY